jgi:hypothetical protein
MTSPEANLQLLERPETTQTVDPYEQVVAVVQQALPMLEWQRDESKVLEIQAPLDSDLPTETVEIKPYYFKRSDPRHMGAWKFEQVGYDPVYFSSLPRQEAGNQADVRIGSKMSRDGSAYGEVVVERAQQCAGILGLAVAAFERVQAEQAVDYPKIIIPQPRRFQGIGRAIGIRH